jgi:hypothetical protein
MGSRRQLLLAGVLLVATYFVGWSAEWRWNQQAREAARQRLLLKLPESQQGAAQTSSDADLLYQVSHSGERREWIDSDPWGAEVWQAGRQLGATPLERPSGDAAVVLHTPWRKGAAPQGSSHIALAAGPLTLGLRLAGLIGLAFLALGLGRKSPSDNADDDAAITQAAPLASASMFGDYRQGDLCGTGAMGMVYHAYHGGQGDRLYALKVLNSEWSQSEEFRQRFEREYQICRQLDSDLVVRVHARGEKDGQLWMVMDYVEGPTLDRYLADTRSGQAEILSLALDLCEGLAYAHELGIVHRDLKPDNILVTAQGRPVITDFGLARSQHYDTITRAHTVMGTPAYMAPEQVDGSGIDQRADLYSLGCILYEALAGRPPFVGEAMEVVMAQLTREPDPISQHTNLSSEAESLIHRLLAKDKNRRFSSADQVRSALLEIVTKAH